MSKEQRRVEWSLDLDHMRVRAGQLVSDVMGGSVETKQASLREPLNHAVSAKVDIAFPVGQAIVKALDAQSPSLFEAELNYVGEYEYTVSGAAERIISLRQKGGSAGDFGAMASKAQDLRWDIALARDLPLRLRVAAGVGEAKIDLSGLQIDALQLTTGVGKVQLTLPAQSRPIIAAIRGGVGVTEIEIAPGAYGELDIKGGLGELRATASQGIAARVEAKTGLGAIDVPERFVRVSGESKAKSLRVWQTADYTDAEQTMTIRYTGGVGRFRLKTAD